MFTVTDEQRLVAETTRRFLADHGRDTDPEQLWHRGADLGWTSLLAETDAPGRFSALALLALEFGRAIAPGPLGPANVAVQALSRDDRYAAELGLLETGAATAAWVAGVTAQRTTTGYTLHGDVRPVEGAAGAKWLLVSTEGLEPQSALLVEADRPGVLVTPLQSLDLHRTYAEVKLDQVEVPAEARVQGADPDELLDLAVLVQLGEMLGAMEWSFETTMQWTFHRYSFGRPLAAYQAIQHRAADLAMWLEASRAVVGEAARAFDTGAPDRAELVSAAKTYVGKVGPELLQECVQLHGGLGVTAELDLHLYLRRVAAAVVTHGTPRDHAVRLARIAEGREQTG